MLFLTREGNKMAVYPYAQQVKANVATTAYRQSQVAYASPAEILLQAYDIAISACARGDAQRSTATLVELINSLDFEYREIAVGLLRLYNYCLDLIKKDRFTEARDILADLRSTWAQALAVT